MNRRPSSDSAVATDLLNPDGVRGAESRFPSVVDYVASLQSGEGALVGGRCAAVRVVSSRWRILPRVRPLLTSPTAPPKTPAWQWMPQQASSGTGRLCLRATVVSSFSGCGS